MKLISWIF